MAFRPIAKSSGKKEPSVWAKIAEAKEFKSGVHITPGKYKFEVQRMIMQAGHRGVCFIAELLVWMARWRCGDEARRPMVA